MWPFNKKHPRPNDIKKDGPWQMLEGEYNGKPMLVRKNRGLENCIGHPEYPHQVGIAVPLRFPEPNGFPSGEENWQIGEIEDLLCAELEPEHESLFAAAITTSGMKEFVFYTSNPDSVRSKFQQIKSKITTHEIQLMIQPDKEWNTYRRLS